MSNKNYSTTRASLTEAIDCVRSYNSKDKSFTMNLKYKGIDAQINWKKRSTSLKCSMKKYNKLEEKFKRLSKMILQRPKRLNCCKNKT